MTLVLTIDFSPTLAILMVIIIATRLMADIIFTGWLETLKKVKKSELGLKFKYFTNDLKIKENLKKIIFFLSFFFN